MLGEYLAEVTTDSTAKTETEKPTDKDLIVYESHLPSNIGVSGVLNTDSFVLGVSPPHVPQQISINAMGGHQHTEREISREIGSYTDREGLPANLPVRPFQSGGSSVAFAEMGRFFTPHIDIMPQKEEVVESIAPEIKKRVQFIFTPTAREDISLVATAVLMFLVVIVLLGYMYSNGRI